MKRIVLTFALLAATTGSAAAQSLFATRGLGLPVPSVDARSRALGGIGVGLMGLDLSLANPAEAAGIGLRGISASLQPGTASPEIGGQTGSLSAARFPLVRAVYPIGDRSVMSVGFGSFLDQSWGVQLSGQEVIGSDTVGVTDVIQARGSVARLSFGVAYEVTPSVALGLSGGLNTGNLDRRVSRTFADSTVGLRPFDTRLRWNYGGAFGTAGARIDLADVARIGGSITLSQKLDIRGVDDNARDDEADIPLRVTAGASATLSSALLATAGFEWNGGVDGVVFNGADATALQRSTLRYGGGIEFAGLRKGTRVFPLRFGGSRAQLPFYDQGEEPADETSFSIGLGLRLADSPAGPLAVGDISFERGSRSGLESASLADGLKESFWRVTFSLSLFGN